MFGMDAQVDELGLGHDVSLAPPRGNGKDQSALDGSCRAAKSGDLLGGKPMKETTLTDKPDAKSPAGADIRFIMDGALGNMIHSTVPPGQINRATIHATVSEFWHVLEGEGEIWRKDTVADERVTSLRPGVSIDIPVATAFQYRNIGNKALKFICISMPPWPGDDEATHVKGAWEPTI